MLGSLAVPDALLCPEEPPSAAGKAEGTLSRAALPEAAGRHQGFPRQPAGVLRGQKHRDGRDVLRLPQASQRGARN